VAERKAWWEILRDQFAARGLLDPESERIQEATQALPSVQRQARGLLSLDPQAESDTALDIAVGFTPLQYPQAARDFERSRRAGDKLGMGLATLAAVPVVGGVAKAAGKARKADVAAERAEALLTAQRNAAKPISEGGLGLRPDNTPMERAEAMGFKDGLYHGAVNDFPFFEVNERRNVYATDEPVIADIYANAVGRHRGLREVNAGPNVIPLMYRGELIEVSDRGPTGGGWVRDNLAEKIGEAPRRNLYKELPSKGFSGAKVTDMDDLGGRQTQYVFPDPTVLRSRFAAFDPAKLTSPDLLAGVAGPTVLAAALLEQKRREKEKQDKGL